jgi:hypothetical protein
MACTCVNDDGEFSDIVNCSVIGSQPYDDKWVCFGDIPLSCFPSNNRVCSSSAILSPQALTIRRTSSPTRGVWLCIAVTSSQRGSAYPSSFAWTADTVTTIRPAELYREHVCTALECGMAQAGNTDQIGARKHCPDCQSIKQCTQGSLSIKPCQCKLQSGRQRSPSRNDKPYLNPPTQHLPTVTSPAANPQDDRELARLVAMRACFFPAPGSASRGSQESAQLWPAQQTTMHGRYPKPL